MNDLAPGSKDFAYGVHTFGLIYSAGSMMAVADAYALPEEEMDMEYYGDEYYGDNTIIDDYYGGDYYYGGYYWVSVLYWQIYTKQSRFGEIHLYLNFLDKN